MDNQQDMHVGLIRVDGVDMIKSVGLPKLAQDRNGATMQKAKVKQLEAELAETELYKEIQTEKEKLINLLQFTEETDGVIRKAAIASYEEDPNKNKSVCDGVSIAEYTTFNIDEELAVTWASKHHHKALKLNLVEIKKVAKAGMEVAGVQMGKENRVKIASDLSQYLSD